MWTLISGFIGRIAVYALAVVSALTAYLYIQNYVLESQLQTCRENNVKLKEAVNLCEDQAKNFSEQLRYTEQRYEQLKTYYKNQPKPPKVDDSSPIDDALLNDALGVLPGRSYSPNTDTNPKGAGSRQTPKSGDARSNERKAWK